MAVLYRTSLDARALTQTFAKGDIPFFSLLSFDLLVIPLLVMGNNPQRPIYNVGRRTIINIQQDTLRPAGYCP